MDDTDVTSDRRLLGFALAAFLALVLLAAVDVLTDLGEGTTVEHVVTEGTIIAIALVGAGVVLRQLIETTRRARSAAAESAARSEALEGQLEVTRAEAERWRSEARDLMAGLGRAIDEQFERWALSPAEKETGLLLLKGLSHKEIAEARSVTEATARQQARSLYKKAGLSGRADLAAFFLEDLMLPP